MKISDLRLRISDSLKFSDFSNSLGYYSTPNNTPMGSRFSGRSERKFGEVEEELYLGLFYFIITSYNKKLIRGLDSERELSLRRHRTRSLL